MKPEPRQEARRKLDAEARQAFATALLKSGSSRALRPNVKTLVYQYGPVADSLIGLYAAASNAMGLPVATYAVLLALLGEGEAGTAMWTAAGHYHPLPDVKQSREAAPLVFTRLRTLGALLERLADELGVSYTHTDSLRGRENLVPLAQLVIFRAELDWSQSAYDLVSELDVVPAVTLDAKGRAVRYGRRVSGKLRAAADQLLGDLMGQPSSARRAKSGRRRPDRRAQQAAARRAVLKTLLPAIQRREFPINELVRTGKRAQDFHGKLTKAGVTERPTVHQLYRDVKILSR